MIKIIFRFDDPSEISDHDLEIKILNLFIKYNAKICLAIIPFKKRINDETIWTITDSKIKHIIESVEIGVVEVAQHGCSHVDEGMNCIGSPSEFSGVPYDYQARKIMEGRELLSSIFNTPIIGFVPPFNTYDANTVKILAENNYEYISAAWDTPVFDKKRHDIVILPRTCTLRHINIALKEAEKYKSLSPIINVVLHHDEFDEHVHAKSPHNQPTFTNLTEIEKLLKMINNNPEMEICSISSVSRILNKHKGHPHIAYMKWKAKLYWRLRPCFPDGLILIRRIRTIILHVIKGFIRI